MQAGIPKESYVRVTIAAPALADVTIRRHVIAQTRLFCRRGDHVYVAVSIVPDSLPDELMMLGVTVGGTIPPSDLSIYHHTDHHPLLTSLREQDQGLVIVHDHGTAPKSWLPAHYADLCLVDDTVRRDELICAYGLTPARVQVLPSPGHQADYENAMNHWVHQVSADDWSQIPGAEDRLLAHPRMTEPVAGVAALRGDLHLGESQADIMLRDYTVHSRIPVVGGLVAWLRRNLTSHLREPYLDPTLERQVAFNRTVLDWMEQVQTRLEALENTVQDLQIQLSPPTQERVPAVPDDQPLDNAQESNDG